MIGITYHTIFFFYPSMRHKHNKNMLHICGDIETHRQMLTKNWRKYLSCICLTLSDSIIENQFSHFALRVECEYYWQPFN
jgi:hypothetical protein